MTSSLRRAMLAATLTAAIPLFLGGASAEAQTVRYEGATTVSPTSLNFKRVKVGNSSDVERVVVNRRRLCWDVNPPFGLWDCNFWSSDIAVSGSGFEITRDCLVSGPTCTVWVKFKPTRRGRSEGFLRVDSNPIVGVPLLGKGCRTVKGERRCWRKGAK